LLGDSSGMKRWLVVLLAMVAMAAAAPVHAISLVVEREDGWVATAPRADRAGDAVLPGGFSEETRNALDARLGVVLIVVMLGGLALAAFPGRVAFIAEHRPRRL